MCKCAVIKTSHKYDTPDTYQIKYCALHAEAKNLLALLKEAYEPLECYNGEAHRKGTCLDQRIKSVIQKAES